ncbi:MAG: hypothetical protein GF311_28350 [Candidatus Lokiarchaeota archaeon]|nr:hypothetical protein [Candidatus Lokiarchaeota archaeon]
MKNKSEEIKKLQKKLNDLEQFLPKQNYYDPCKNCSNNKEFFSVCNCTLPYMHGKYRITGVTYV